MQRFTGPLAIGATAVVGFLLVINSTSSAGAAPDGSKIYANNCAACHANGGNIVDPKKPVKGSKVLATKQSFKENLLKPKGSMTAFPQIANNDADLSALYEYCKSLK